MEGGNKKARVAAGTAPQASQITTTASNRTRRRRQKQGGIPQDHAAWMAFVRAAARGGK